MKRNTIFTINYLPMHPSIQTAFRATRNSRRLLAEYLDNYTLEQLNTIPPGFNNNMIWNIAHVMVSQQRLVYMLSGLPMMIADDMANRYMKGTKPEFDVTAEEVEEIRVLLFTTLDKTEEDYKNGVFKNYREYTTGFGFTLFNAEEAIQFNNYHEGTHLGVLLSLKKFV
ncbi:DinB family protein [Flavobacterium rhizosphaerae]|uniref:DinB family protein n=1 Tax=Flavobacterium rhizosphaerae TaxID=3163298 RepID=A0ABW8YZL8_9FLAO